ncbi:MAG: beta-propeller fold lactonase family protein, partial [Planctomycetota bacterium]|nr:beta-propeller fold lactonase family protein [Planctomycetota bacterium]
MRLSPWLAPLTDSRSRLADKVVRRKVTRRRKFNRLSQMTERLEARTLLTSLFNVNSFFDTVDVNPGDSFAADATGRTSLRAAIMQANASAGSDTITLGGGIFNLSIEGTDEDSAFTGDLDITDNLTIQGQSAQTTIIDARTIDRIFDVMPGVSLQLFNVTITGGNLSGRGDGGGIRVDNGMLQLNDVVVTGNQASNGGGLQNNQGLVFVTNSTFSENRAEGNVGFAEGGAINSFGGTVIVRQSTISNNFAQTVGGGISGGADTFGGTLSIENSTIAQNHAGEMQGGNGEGGGISIQANVDAFLRASTIAFNSAGNQGAGIWTNGSLTLERTIVSNNLGTPDDGPEGFISGGTVTSNGFNLIREDTDFNFTPATGDLIGIFASPIDPNLLGLADNGGPTQTIALGGMSPAIDAGPSIASPLFADQRGFARERDGDRNGSVITDIGAFEVQSPFDVFVDDIGSGSGMIIGGFAGDFQVIMDGDGVTGGGGGTPNGILDFGDIVTFDPGGQPVFNLEFGVRAFGTINDALTAIRFDSDFLTEVVLGSGTYTENLTLDFSGLTLRGHTGIATDVVVDGDGAAAAISVVENAVSLESLRVTNATTGIDVAPFSSAQFFDAKNIQVDGTTNGLTVFDSIGFMDVSIENSVFTGNTGDGINITNVGTAMLRNVSSTFNGQDGVEIVDSTIVAFDTVTVDQNSGRGLVVDGADTIAVMNPRTSASTNGNVFSNSSTILFNGVTGPVSNSTTITATEIQFDAGAGAVQEAITLTNVTSLFVTGDEGNDTLTVDYSAGSPSPSRQLFLDGGRGRDTIQSVADTNHRVTEARLTIGGIDEVAITSFEQASLTGGAGNNNLDARGFYGQTTLSGLAGNDTLRGSAGDDVLDGGADDDILQSGPTREQYIVGETTFENLNLSDSDTGVMTILDETDTETAAILLDSDFFRFNDVFYAGNVLFVSTSGAVSFGGPIFPQNNFDLNNAPNPSIGILAPLFDDWVTGINSPPGLTLPDSKVLYKFEDTNADFINDRLIVEWNDVFHRDQIDTLSTPFLKAGASPVTFQLILELNTSDRDGDITFNYVDLDTGTPFSAIANGASATVGGKDAGENPSGIEQVSFNSPSTLIGSGQAIAARSGKSDGDDILIGGVGDDALYSSSGLDSADGGAGSNDRLVFDGLKNDLASDHVINNSAVESTIFPGQGRSFDFKTSYSNIEALDVDFGPADQNVLVELSGLPAEVSLDTRGPSASDKVTINGTAGNDALTLSGETLTDGTTTLNLAGIEELTLEISSGGADTISVDQNFTGSARTVIVSGDSADDLVSLQSTTKPQQVNIFNGNAYIAQVKEVLGGNLVLEEILNDGGDDGSENTIANQQAPDQVIVSPDGTRVYVAASDSDSLVVYNRDRVTGDLTFVESLVNGMTDFHGGTISGLNGASNVIVSADGRYVYVASEVDQTIAFFVHHEGDNQLTFITSTVLDTAGNPVSIPLPSDMAFIPDGSVLLVTSESGNRIDFFEVSGSGDLTFQASLVDGGRDSDMRTIDGIGGASSVAISPDGRFIYASGATDNAIAVFSSPPHESDMTFFGESQFVQKLANGDMDGALNLVSGLGGASAVEISPDGRHVYVTGETDNSIAVFSQDSDTGELTFVEKLVDLGLDSMSNTVENLSAPVSVSLSPDGTKVYVAASGSNAVTLFARDIFTGVLTFQETLAAGDTDGAGTTITGVNGASSVFASVDGQHVYVSGTGDDAIVRFNVPRQLDVSTGGFAGISVATSDADDTISLSLDGQPAMVTINAGGDGDDNDSVVIQGTSADDTVDVNGETVTTVSTTFSITSTENLSLSLKDGDDTVNVTASSSGPESFFVDGGNQSGGDVLNVDAQAAQTVDIDASISFSDGQQTVSYSDFETVAISNAAPTINGDTFAIAENSPVGTSVGTAFASDPESGESLTWRIVSGNTGNAFAINSLTGEITVATELDFETLNTYSLVVEVEDNQSLTDQATITINVTDVKPVVNDQSFNVFENQINGSAVGTVMLEPGDMNSVVFSIAGGNTGGAFAIDEFSGLISVANAEAITFGGPPFLLTIEVTDDGGETSDSGTITIDVLEMPPAGAVFDDAIDSGGGALVGPFASLDNGPGDGSVSISSVDAYGQFFSAVYDPIDDDPAGTTFDSEVYFRFGSSGTRQSLIDASGESGSSIRSLNDEANSSFNIGDLTFVLTQTLEPVFDEFGNQSGSLLTQTYRIMNTGESSQAFELVRYLDGDLEFDGSIDEGGGRLQLPTGEDLLFETDLGTSPETSTKFLGITGFGGTPPEVGRFQIEEFSVLQSAIANGDLLTDDLSNFGNAVDGNGDQFVDEGLEFDLSLSLANLFVLGASQSATYTTHTLFGSDSPSNATGNTAPTLNTQSFSVDENSTAETFVGTVLADDLETPSNLTFAITGGDP